MESQAELRPGTLDLLILKRWTRLVSAMQLALGGRPQEV